ncbi:unnamed protein product [Polarella glacialis]|uniref:Prolyl 4-hydroxylase alpha subunit Fe(2+) 2OG dioxygenase domain-containing protein n=1 Tax=Polarella glacialis TaxID=89957 RepID=A0A813LKF3_POLGL|nr:unnamed protein product [Polarella glacialis]
MDGALGPRWAAALAAEAAALERASLLTPHTFEFAVQGGSRQVFEHPGRRYVDLDPSRVQSRTAQVAPLLARFAEQEVAHLLSRLEATSPELAFAHASVPHVKLQLTHGEYGCTPCHYDISFSAPTTLQLSILFYLSDGWCQDWGAELQVLPFVGPPVAFEPTFDRAVLFLADRTLHRSLPPRGQGVGKARWLLTVWLDGAGAVDRAWRPSALAPPMQRLVAPALHCAAYLEALTQSLPPGEARTSLLAQQQCEITDVEGDAELVGLLEGLRELQADSEEEEADPMQDFVAACEPSAKKQRCDIVPG